jgi:hypothetical protein
MSDIDNANPSAQWSEADGNNTAPAPDGFPQAGSPAQDLWVDVPANGRALMGAIKRFWDRINGTVNAGGSAGAYTYMPSNNAFPLAYVQGETYSFKAGFTSVGGDTLTIQASSLPAKPLYKSSFRGPIPVAAGDIQNGQIVQAIYDNALNAGNGGFQITGGASLVVGPMVGFRGLAGIYSSTNPKGASWSVSEIIAETALGGAAYKGTNLSLSFDGTTTGFGGMDTGSMPTSADLSVYAIYNPTSNIWNTLGCLGSTSRGPVYTGANMPSGYTASALIYVGVTDGSGQFLLFVQHDRTVWIPSANVLTNGNSTGISSFLLTSCVPFVATACAGNFATGAGGGGSLEATGGGAIGYQFIGGTSGMLGNFGFIPLVAAQTLFYQTTTTLVNFSVAIDSYQF